MGGLFSSSRLIDSLDSLRGEIAQQRAEIAELRIAVSQQAALTYEIAFRDFNAYLNMTETTADTVEKLADIFRGRYGIEPNESVCFLTGIRGSLKLAHIVPRSTKSNILDFLELSHADINDVRNLVFLCWNIEHSYDRLKVSFVPRSRTDDTLVLKIWDDSVRKMPVFDGADKEKHMKLYNGKVYIGDYENEALQLKMPNNAVHNPYRRCFAYQALLACLQHDREGASHYEDRQSDISTFNRKRKELIFAHQEIYRAREADIRNTNKRASLI